MHMSRSVTPVRAQPLTNAQSVTDLSLCVNSCLDARRTLPGRSQSSRMRPHTRAWPGRSPDPFTTCPNRRRGKAVLMRTLLGESGSSRRRRGATQPGGRRRSVLPMVGLTVLLAGLTAGAGTGWAGMPAAQPIPPATSLPPPSHPDADHLGSTIRVHEPVTPAAPRLSPLARTAPTAWSPSREARAGGTSAPTNANASWRSLPSSWGTTTTGRTSCFVIHALPTQLRGRNNPHA